MVASRKSINAVVATLRSHLDDEQILPLLADLLRIPGNISFTVTINEISKQFIETRIAELSDRVAQQRDASRHPRNKR
jgi:hypothetical protein